MKKILKTLTCLVCAMLCLFSFSACGKETEEIYSNMTKSGFNNYLTDEDTTTKFNNYQVSLVEKDNGEETLKITLKTRTLSGKSIGIATYKSGGLNVVVYISQTKVYFQFKNSSGTVIEAQNHIVTLDFFAKESVDSKGLNINETIVIKSLYSCMANTDAQLLYENIKEDTERLDVDYSVKFSIKNAYDKYKIKYSAAEEVDDFAEEYTIDTYLEFKNDTINKIEYVKSGKQIDDTSFSNYELKVSVSNYNDTITLPEEINA